MHWNIRRSWVRPPRREIFCSRRTLTMFLAFSLVSYDLEAVWLILLHAPRHLGLLSRLRPLINHRQPRNGASLMHGGPDQTTVTLVQLGQFVLVTQVSSSSSTILAL